MPTTLRIAAAVLIGALLPARAEAWGAEAHRYIMRRAIDLLPASLRPLFVEHRDEVVFRVNDPDLWRIVGWNDDPNHFLDFGSKELGPFPFAALPREYDKALEKFGRPTLERLGTLPWRFSEMAGHLRRSFEGFQRNSPYTVSDTVVFTAVASHYLQDAHQPLHAAENYDGQLSGQRGVHSRFERDLIERYLTRLTVTPPAVKPITNARDTAFEVLLRSYQRVEPLLEADKAALAGRTAYDDQYFEAFLAGVQPMLERSLAESISATAGLIIGAWEQAGRPAVRARDVRPVQRAPQP